MYRIQQLSQATGISTEAIRYYERIGVLPAARRAENGYRVYTDADVERLKFVSGARKLDISLDEISGILTFRNEGLAPCTHVRALVKEQITEVERRIHELEQLRDDLRRLDAAGESLPEDTEMQDCICGLISERD